MTDFIFSRVLESDPEDETIAWAENNGWIARMMSYRGRRGCPDVFFFGYGKILPIEFKKPNGGRLSAGQVEEHKRLRNVGVIIPVFDTSKEAINYLKKHMD
jgi:hypothetical protein